MQQPIVYFAFANDPTAHLAQLKEESGALKSALLPMENKEYIKLEREESVSNDKLIELLASYKDRIAIFHYAGHAESDHLRMEGGEAFAKGVAALMKDQENIKLVFLNGCSTKGQVEAYLAAGIKAVIATSVPIEDTMAKDFSTAFYQAMANKRSIKRAFEFAYAAIQSKYNDVPPAEIHRGMGRAATQKKSDALPWGLYLNEIGGDEVLSWRLPFYRREGLPAGILSRIQKDVDVNKFILMILDDMCRYNEDIYHQKWERREGEDRRLDSSKLLNLVIENFPWIIGSQVRLLRDPMYIKPDQSRLEQLVSTYIVSAQMLYFILLSDFWEIRLRETLDLPKGFLSNHQMTKGNLLNSDFLAKAASVYEVLADNDCEMFMPELEGFFEQLKDEKSYLFMAKGYLENIRKELGGTITDLEQKCLQTEQALSIILKEMAFLSGYKLLAVRDISIENPRGSEMEYDLAFGKLNGLAEHELTIYKDAENRRKKSFTNCSSIILASTEKNFNHYLNLSPFLIDKNTFVGGKLIDPFLFGFEEENHFYYYRINHNVYVAIENEKGTDIISTDMTDKDFAEGRNITANEKTTNNPFAAAFGGTTEDQGEKVFAILEQQFEKFKSDLM